ncbi:MAG: flavodoxin-dependent (E)-4-hydroxy-3-methylbut-2-enyl-diphosphate synthase, partial [Bacteroidaceae bacterium]|nr:flavodoxin-dependent (E)-4-hydroxy-3-methylbut-2-enyl-diphosphate synthase [Bacteroidaceae bacterium]
MDLFNYNRRPTVTVHVGNTEIGCSHPVRVQSMTNTSTMDTQGSVEQIERIVEQGGELVRLTTQGSREAINMGQIKSQLQAHGVQVPLVADVHFNASVADVAAQYADKVRVNPGNYVDTARTFKHIEYTDEEYADELVRLRQRFTSFLDLCRKQGKAIRVGVNHGSLSDRIMSRYGDTPGGVVESCMEFLRICRDKHFDNVVVSIKTSNTPMMVTTVRLLVQTMNDEGIAYP